MNKRNENFPLISIKNTQQKTHQNSMNKIIIDLQKEYEEDKELLELISKIEKTNNISKSSYKEKEINDIELKFENELLIEKNIKNQQNILKNEELISTDTTKDYSFGKQGKNFDSKNKLNNLLKNKNFRYLTTPENKIFLPKIEETTFKQKNDKNPFQNKLNHIILNIFDTKNKCYEKQKSRDKLVSAPEKVIINRKIPKLTFKDQLHFNERK